MIAFDLTPAQAHELVTVASRRRATSARRWDHLSIIGAENAGGQLRVVFDGTGIWLDGAGKTRTALYAIRTCEFLDKIGVLTKEAAV